MYYANVPLVIQIQVVENKDVFLFKARGQHAEAESIRK